jgi:CheY-like chemotaxis protein
MSQGRKTVLVVDDDAAIRRLETVILEREGYAVSQASGGAAALDRLDRGGLDLLLLDVRMPVVDGWEVMESVAAMPQPPKVVIVTGWTDPLPDHLRPFIDATLAKPFQPAELIQACQRAAPLS